MYVYNSLNKSDLCVSFLWRYSKCTYSTLRLSAGYSNKLSGIQSAPEAFHVEEKSQREGSYLKQHAFESQEQEFHGLHVLGDVAVVRLAQEHWQFGGSVTAAIRSSRLAGNTASGGEP